MNQLKWFYPGLRVKRWISLIILGVMMFSFGATFIIGKNIPLHIYAVVKESIKKPGAFGIFITLFGIIFIIYGVRRLTVRFINLFMPEGEVKNVVDILYEDVYLKRGIKIVGIGGGTGLHSLLRGLKTSTSNLTAIVTVSDDGGSSGRLRDELNMLPPGDIRQCIAALASEESAMADLFSSRFKGSGDLKDHSVGNLLIAAMTELKGDFFLAVQELSKVLAIKGKVIPATLCNATLCAELADGMIVRGETNITKSAAPIRRVFLSPSDCKALPEAVESIMEADLIVIGPGSLYTSIMPNLLVKDIAAAMRKTNAAKVYVCNIMSQPGETDDYSAADHAAKIVNILGKRSIDYIIVNKRFPSRQLARYERQGQHPVHFNVEELKRLGIQHVIVEELMMEDELVRHDPDKLAAAVMDIATKLLPATGPRRWPTDVDKIRDTLFK